MPTWDEFVIWTLTQSDAASGRSALRRQWRNLRNLAATVATELEAGEIEALLGKPLKELDPEKNDLKALVAYGVGKGLVVVQQLQAALREDTRADPLHFLAQHSGKTFGEKFAPAIAGFWLARDADTWTKQSSKKLYDVGWSPSELDGRVIRIELKASSERPSFLFQQIRHWSLSGAMTRDYDLLLCLGVSAGELGWWALPVETLDRIADTGTVASDQVVITRHHGKRRSIWNAEHGYGDEGWFRADARVRALLIKYNVTESDQLRSKILSYF